MSGNTIYSVNQECRQANDDDVLRQYVAGLLPEAAAEEFEEHMFACDACAEEVQRAIELRAALPPAIRRSQRRPYSLLAAAAAAAVVAVGLWQVRLRQEPIAPPPLRSATAHEIKASGHLVGTTFTASWNAVSDARSYRVQVFDSVGQPVTWTETASTRFSAPIGSASRGEPRYWKVQALDDDHVVIASSELRKIESR
ncbi:MAG TPA: zf-HC2 domain-containing protein [Thermoanaerobaculia bacterium]